MRANPIQNIPLPHTSITDELFVLADRWQKEGMTTKKLTQQDLRLLSGLVKLIHGQDYIVMTNAEIAKRSNLNNEKSVITALNNLDTYGVINRIHVRNHQGIKERRISISKTFATKYPILTTKLTPTIATEIIEPKQTLPKLSAPTPTAEEELIKYQQYRIDRELTKYANALERIKVFKQDKFDGDYDYAQEIKNIETFITIEKFYQKHNTPQTLLNREQFQAWLDSDEAINLLAKGQMYYDLSDRLEFFLAVYEGRVDERVA